MNSFQSWRRHLPLTYPNIIWRKLDKKAKTMLDVGCCKGKLMAILNQDKTFAVAGIDIYGPYLKEAEKTGVYQTVRCEDARKIRFKDKSFDIAFCSQVLEHLKKEDGEKLIDLLEGVAKTQVVIATTVGFLGSPPFEIEDGNPYLGHKSGWQPEEFERRGYRVYGQGAGFVYGEKGITKLLPRFLHPLALGLAYLFSPLVYFFPQLACIMICVKTVKD